MKKLAPIASLVALSLLAVTPVLADPYGTSGGSRILNLVGLIKQIVDMLIPLLIAVALVVFFWGLVKFIWGGGEDHDKGRNIMIAGLIALFIMVSVWGIIRLAQSILLGGDSNDNTGGISAPKVPE
jgi:hypothetical protein